MTTTPTGHGVAQAANAADPTAQVDRQDLSLEEALQARDAEGLALGIKLPEAAKLLGVSDRHLYSQAKGGFVPSYRIGNALLFSPVALREWVASQSAASLLASRRALEARLLAVPERPIDPDAGHLPAPKTVHVHRAGQWVTELPSTFVE